MTGEHGLARIDHASGGLSGKARKKIDRGRDVVQRAGPAATRLACPAVFRRADGKSLVGKRGSERPGVRAVEGNAPETAVQKDDQGLGRQRRVSGPLASAS
jgi:hypothetical protein